MAEKHDYKLIRETDPTKIRLPVNDKFAKLTLSSNKKRQEQQHVEEVAESAGKAKRVSRSLLESFCASDQTAATLDDIADLSPAAAESHGDGDEAASELVVLSQRLSSLRVSTKPSEVVVDAHQPIDISMSTEEEGEEESELCITVSDSSCDEQLEPGPLVSQTQLESGTDLALDDANVPHEKRQLFKNFLHDVSKAGRLPPQQQQRPTVDYEHNLALANTETMSSLNEADIREIMSWQQRTKTKPVDQPTPLDRDPMMFAQISTETMSTLHESDIAAINRLNAAKQAAHQERERPVAAVEGALRYADDDTIANTSEEQLTDDDDVETDTEAADSSQERIDASDATNVSAVTIPETDSECENDRPSLSPASSVMHNIKSESVQHEGGSESISVKGGVSISAQINIKIQFSTANINVTPKSSLHESANDTDGDTESSGGSLVDQKSSLDNTVRVELHRVENTSVLEQCDEVENSCDISKDLAEEQSTEPEAEQSPKAQAEEHNCSFDVAEQSPKAQAEELNCSFEDAERLLTELYGETWRTPTAVREIKRTFKSTVRKANTLNTKQAPTVASHGAVARPRDLIKERFKKGLREELTPIMGRERPAASRQLFEPEPEPDPDPVHNVPSIVDFDDLPQRSVEQNIKSKQQELTPKKKTAGKTATRTNKKQYETPVPATGAKFTDKRPKRAATAQAEQRWRQLIDSESSESEANASDDDKGSTNTKKWSSSFLLESASDTESDFEVPKKLRSKSKPKSQPKQRVKQSVQRDDEIVYLDLTKPEVEQLPIESVTKSPPANKDSRFQAHLEQLLGTDNPERKDRNATSATRTLPTEPKLPSRRRLFTPNVGHEDELAANEIVQKALAVDRDCLVDLENIYSPSSLVFKRVQVAKKLSSDSDKDEATFKKPLTSSNGSNMSPNPATPKSLRAARRGLKVVPGSERPIVQRYTFLKSLDPFVDKNIGDPLAIMYRENYNTKKEELTKELYKLYKSELFGEAFNAEVIWNKKLLTTAGVCRNKKRGQLRSSIVELSEKVCTSADRLRCTLIHELCHAATWIFSGEGGHGPTWKSWAKRANKAFPDLPKIGVCHQYEIEYKYTYKCTLCDAKSYSHSNSKRTDNIRCSFCHGAIEVFLNKKNKQGVMLLTPVQKPKGFAKFVQDNYKQHKRPSLTHADVMKILSSEFAKLKTTNNSK